MTEPIRAGYNLSRTSEIGRWRAVSLPRTAALGHRCGGFPRCAARLVGAPRGVVASVFLVLKWCGDIGDTHPGFNVAGDDLKVADSGGLNFLSFDGVARPHPRTSGLKVGFPSFLVLSSRSYPVQLLREAVNWCPRRSLRVLGFDPKRAKLRAPWPPIYRGFGLISKRILLRSHFEPSIEFVSALARFNLMGKTPGVLRTQDELGRAVTVGSVMTPSQLGQLGRPVAYLLVLGQGGPMRSRLRIEKIN
jgi:hypothetical protein